ncbi:hypothetical protein EGW08_000700, partial [Elysia chlorotica]
LITNFADMDETMHTITKDVAEDAKITSNNIRTVLKGISTFFAKHVTEWHDHDNLDLLHHLIINNKADLIGFIFVETMLFPLGYVPPCNPYAHLAAFLGHAECLKVILQHRPGAFFRIQKSEHAIKLPEAKFEKHLNKTPLSYAAERGHIDCVYYLLETVVMKRNPSLGTKEPLTLATKARSPESIMLLLTIEKRVTSTDYLSAVMLSIREMYPECLISLLTNKGKSRHTVFDGTNLYHILFSQSVISSRRYELMPEMTRALVSSKEDVNAHGSPRTYPMYTLINCAFNITVGKQIFFFIDCLYILLECKANPHFDETRSLRAYSTTEKFTRQAYTSAISCVFESAKNSVNFFESTYWSNLFMKKFITTIEMHDLTPRRVLNNVLFDYMEAVCVLGLDRTIVRCLLRYGANPDFKKNDKYPVNVYFDQIFPYLTKFEIVDTSGYYKQELHTLMIIARSMSLHCQSEALSIFLTDHLLTAPIQALPISREFASLMGQMVRTPRPLLQLVINCIWVATKRNKKKVRDLPIPEVYMASIIP